MASDAELIGWSLVGDGSAFVEVVHRHGEAVSAYLVRRAGSGPAEDLLSEVWVAALGSRGSYDRSFPDARPWLFGIARNVLRSHWGHRTDQGPARETTPTVLADPWPEVDERIDGAALLRRAVKDLPPDEREVLLLVVWEQLSVADAGRALGMPAGTARFHLHRARLALRDAPGMVALLNELNAVKSGAMKEAR
ncbi:MAG: RNA polymerase sigma factor [Acidimicrobiales bacterium]